MDASLDAKALAAAEAAVLAFRRKLLEGRGMLLVPELWCSALGGIFEPWSVVTKDGVEYVVIPEPWMPDSGDGYYVKPTPPDSPFAHPSWKSIGVKI